MKLFRATAIPRVAAGFLILVLPTLHGTLLAQTGSYDAYLNHADLTAELQSLVELNQDLCRLESMAVTSGGLDLWMVTIGNPNNGHAATNPGLLVVANIEGNHLIGSMAALYLVDHLANGYGNDPAITDLINTHTIYVVPRLNPDGAELYWSQPGIEIPWKADPEDEDRDGSADEDPGDDINGDGLVTKMRVQDPDGIWMVDPDEPRLLKRADRTRGEQGIYTIYTEGLDDDSDGEYNEDGPGGTHLNRNWPHNYPYYQNHAGINQVSEIETRALADFAFTHRNLVMALTFSPYDNLITPPQPGTEREAPVSIPEGLELPPGVSMEEVMEYFRVRSAPRAILSQDAPYFNFISEHFREMTGLSGKGTSGEAGSWPQFAYYQLGLPSFTTPVWTLEAESNGDQSTAASDDSPRTRMAALARMNGGTSEDQKWLQWFESNGIEGFVDWTPANHPDLGEVEVGGFAPNARVNPPVDRIIDLCEQHARFAIWLGAQSAHVELVDTEVEVSGPGYYLIRATIQNDRYLPSAMEMALRTRRAQPVTLRLLPIEGMTLIQGPLQQQVRNVYGSGGRATVEWRVQAPPGTRVTLEMLAPTAGGLTSVTISLSQEGR
ncbi:M14 family metallopeptidase [Candidatus Zixiibacteriota bacterium]